MQMAENYQLCSPWCVWLNFQVPQDLISKGKQGHKVNKVDYNDYLKKILTITTYNDLIYYWQEARLKDVHEFLVYQVEQGKNISAFFEIDGVTRNISAINYFREGISPTWEDLNNKYGGRLIFQIDKDIDKYQEIYEWLIFYFLGESESCAEDINGIRFISHRPNQTFHFHYRVEVWTKFSLKEQDKVELFRDTFVKDFFNSFLANNPKLKNFKPSFKPNEETPESKDSKEEKQAKVQQKKQEELKSSS